jgi:hypothetical protein
LFLKQFTSLSADPAKFFSSFLTVCVLTLSYATCFPCFSRLRAELAVLRRRGAVRVGGDAPADPGRACGRCRAELGRIINRGAVCRSASTTMPMAKVVVVHYLVQNQLNEGVEMEFVVMNS